MKYPNTKNVFMILISIILVGGAFLFAEYRNKNSKEVYIKNDVSLEKTSTSSLKYSDNNTDWKKVLLTNEMFGSTTITDLTKKAEKLSPSEILSREFFARYMELRQTGDENDEASKQALIDHVLQSNTLTATPKLYFEKDIIIKNDNSSESIKNYGNEIALVFKKNVVTSYRNVALITKDAFDKGDMKILDELDPIIENSKKILKALLKIPSPQEVSKIHIALINNVSSTIYMDEGFKKSATDPYAGIVSVNLVIRNDEGLISAVSELQNVLLDKKITYSPLEDGYLLTFEKI